MDAVAAIEKLIKKRIERALVPGFEPNTGTVATLMGGQSARPQGRREPRAEGRKPPADPIFSKPYEPSAGASQEPKPEAPRSKRKQPQVAALLGGLKRV
jgi:hypothetical protein